MQWYFSLKIGAYMGDRYEPQDIEIPDRPSPLHTFDGEQWQSPPETTLEQLKEAKLLELSISSTAEIETGFDSSALGTPHHYSGKFDNQINLIGGVLTGASIPYTCTNNSDGVKRQRVHTNAQLKQVFQAGGIAKVAITAKYDGLRLQVDAATTLEELASIVW